MKKGSRPTLLVFVLVDENNTAIKKHSIKIYNKISYSVLFRWYSYYNIAILQLFNEIEDRTETLLLSCLAHEQVEKKNSEQVNHDEPISNTASPSHSEPTQSRVYSTVGMRTMAATMKGGGYSRHY